MKYCEHVTILQSAFPYPVLGYGCFWHNNQNDFFFYKSYIANAWLFIPMRILGQSAKTAKKCYNRSKVLKPVKSAKTAKKKC